MHSLPVDFFSLAHSDLQFLHQMIGPFSKSQSVLLLSLHSKLDSKLSEESVVATLLWQLGEHLPVRLGESMSSQIVNVLQPIFDYGMCGKLDAIHDQMDLMEK